MPQDPLKRLKEIKKTLLEAKESKAQLHGRLDALMEDLASTFELESVKEGREKLRGLELELTKKEQQLEVNLQNLDDTLNNIKGIT